MGDGFLTCSDSVNAMAPIPDGNLSGRVRKLSRLIPHRNACSGAAAPEAPCRPVSADRSLGARRGFAGAATPSVDSPECGVSRSNLAGERPTVSVRCQSNACSDTEFTRLAAGLSVGSACPLPLAIEEVRCVFGDDPLDQVDARVDDADGSDDDRRDRLVAVGDRPHDGGVVRVLPDVAVVGRDATSVEGSTELVTERSTRSPEHLDCPDAAVEAVLGCDDRTAVRHPCDQSPVERAPTEASSDSRRNTGHPCPTARDVDDVEHEGDTEAQPRGDQDDPRLVRHRSRVQGPDVMASLYHPARPAGAGSDPRASSAAQRAGSDPGV